MSYTDSSIYKYYQNNQERRANRKIAKADIPFLEDVPDAYDLDDVITEDGFAVFKDKELKKWYIDEVSEGGSGVSQDFYVSLMIGLTTVEYQKYLKEEFNANMYKESMYFDTEEQAVKVLPWLASMRTMAKISGTETITFVEN